MSRARSGDIRCLISSGLLQHFEQGGAVVVADAGTSPLIPEADRPAVAAIDMGALVAAPLLRDGRLVAALCVSDVSSARVFELAPVPLEPYGRARSDLVRPASLDADTVPEIVPGSSQNGTSRANSSHVTRSVKWKNRKDLRGKTKMAEMLIGV